MTTRSTRVAAGTSAGLGGVSIYTCPADTTVIVKAMAVGGPPLVAGSVTFWSVSHRLAGGAGDVCFLSSEVYWQFTGLPASGGIWSGLWEVLIPGDELVVFDDGSQVLGFVASGAELAGVAP